MHLLLFLKGTVFNIPNLVDEAVSAELPDPLLDPTGELRSLVIAYITHGPYGSNNLTAPYIARKHRDGPFECTKRFPKPFTD